MCFSRKPSSRAWTSRGVTAAVTSATTPSMRRPRSASVAVTVWVPCRAKKSATTTAVMRWKNGVWRRCSHTLRPATTSSSGIAVQQPHVVRHGLAEARRPDLVGGFPHVRVVEHVLEVVVALARGLLDVGVDEGEELSVDALLQAGGGGAHRALPQSQQ